MKGVDYIEDDVRKEGMSKEEDEKRGRGKDEQRKGRIKEEGWTERGGG
jgi:hypothetical protein